MPLRPAGDLICLFVVWNTPGPWTCVAMSFTSANSFGAYCWTYSQSALLVPTGSFNNTVTDPSAACVARGANSAPAVVAKKWRRCMLDTISRALPF